MVVGFSYTVQASQGNPSADITKELRQCFDTSNVVTTPSLGDKIQIRNDTIYKPLRSLEAWKKKYERHGEQGLNGFFSPVSQPYETFGELELDLRELVVKTLGANAFQPKLEEPEKQSLWSKVRNNRDVLVNFNSKTTQPQELDNESSKSAKVKNQCHGNKNMTSVIGQRLSLMKGRLAAVRAGQSYEKCLREENQRKLLEILEDQKTEMHLNGPHGPPFVRKKSMLASRKSLATSEDVATLEDAAKLDASELQEYHKRKCKGFVATLKALHSLLCCVYHLKTRDLRTKVPLSRDYLKVMNTEVPTDAKGKPVRHQRLATTAQHTTGSTDSFHIRCSDSDRVTSTNAFPNDSLPNVFRPMTMESGSNLEKQGIGFGNKRHVKNVSTRPNTLEDTSEPGAAQPHHENYAASRSGACRGSFQATFTSAFGTGKARRGVFLGMLANTGNSAEIGHGQPLPIWQQVATNERGDKRICSLSAGRTKDKKSKGGLNLEQLKAQFSDAQKRCSKRLSEDMIRIERLEKCSFIGKLNALKLSHLVEHDVMTMRRATNRIHQDYHDENVRPSSWFELLCDQAMDLDVDDDDEVSTLLEKFAPFSKDDVETLAHVKSKLCLIVQSIPLYELCQLSMQEAIKFFLETILSSPSNTLSDWMAQRKIESPLES